MTMNYRNNISFFYWSRGDEALFEDYSNDLYYHNSLPKYFEAKIFYMSVNSTETQPIPIPVNPPRNVQALLSADRAKVSWKVPHLLGHQGKGAWQSWKYSLEIRDSFNNPMELRNFSSTHHNVDLQLPNTSYTFRVAAYTDGGRGPWCQEFSAKSLNSVHGRQLIWSSGSSLYEADVLGDNVKSILSSLDSPGHVISDLSWFGDLIYMVTNNSIKSLNRTSGELRNITEIRSDFYESVSIAIDWIGRKLYWANPSQQSITRSGLNGEQREELPITPRAMNMKIDSLRGYIYYCSDNKVEAYRPFDKIKTVYNHKEQYSSSKVTGLALDMDHDRVYWIIRGADGSNLYSAPMIENANTNVTYEKIPLGEMSIQGSLLQFSDRLLWLRDDRSAEIADMMGKNVAKIESVKFSSINAISVIDPTQHLFPQNINPIIVVPDAVDETTLRSVGSWDSFNITWSPVTNVNFGTVFYELQIRVGQKTINCQVNVPHYEFDNHPIAPFSPIEIKIRSFTYWAASRTSDWITINSPIGIPMPPNNIRVFVAHNHDLYKGSLNITAYIRWNAPTNKNGVLTNYVVKLCGTEDCNTYNVEPHLHQKILKNISRSGNYKIRVAAQTMAGIGEFSEPITFEPKTENPIPRLLVATIDQILSVDLDLNSTKPVLNLVNTFVKHLVDISREKRIIWTNEFNEIWSCVLPCEPKAQTRLTTLNSEPLSLSVDWIERVLYWTSQEDNRSVISTLNLNKYEEYKDGPKVLLFSDERQMRDVVVSPLDRILLWTEFSNNTTGNGEIMSYDLNTKIQIKFSDIPLMNCKNRFPGLILDTSFTQEGHLVWYHQDRLLSTGIKTKMDQELAHQFQCSHTGLVKDSARLYWIDNDSVYAQNTGNKKAYNLPIPNAKRLLSFYRQNYPNWNCLVPVQKPKHTTYIPTLEIQKMNNITLRLPDPEMHLQCPKRLPTVKYVIFYSQLDSGTDVSQGVPSCTEGSCRIVHSLEKTITITGLKPYSRYRFQVGVQSHYSEHTKIKISLGPSVAFSTSPGAPSQPLDLHAEIWNPNKIKVSWTTPKEINSESIYYVLHYEFEDSYGIKNHRQQDISQISSPEFLLEALNANKTYKIWIRAHATKETFSESDTIYVTTYADPDPIQAANITSNSMSVLWKPQDNVVR